jgi:hypothetical protein
MIFCAKNDARENCQRGKVLTILQIQIDQFQKMSPPKDPTKGVKSVTKWKALSQFCYRNLINFLKKYFLKSVKSRFSLASLQTNK